jgi:hypothetical protein
MRILRAEDQATVALKAERNSRAAPTSLEAELKLLPIALIKPSKASSNCLQLAPSKR